MTNEPNSQNNPNSQDNIINTLADLFKLFDGPPEDTTPTVNDVQIAISKYLALTSVDRGEPDTVRDTITSLASSAGAPLICQNFLYEHAFHTNSHRSFTRKTPRLSDPSLSSLATSLDLFDRVYLQPYLNDLEGALDTSTLLPSRPLDRKALSNHVSGFFAASTAIPADSSATFMKFISSLFLQSAPSKPSHEHPCKGSPGDFLTWEDPFLWVSIQTSIQHGMTPSYTATGYANVSPDVPGDHLPTFKPIVTSDPSEDPSPVSSFDDDFDDDSTQPSHEWSCAYGFIWQMTFLNAVLPVLLQYTSRDYEDRILNPIARDAEAAAVRFLHALKATLAPFDGS